MNTNKRETLYARELARIEFAKFAPIRVKPSSKFASLLPVPVLSSVCIRVHPWLKANPTESFRLSRNDAVYECGEE